MIDFVRLHGKGAVRGQRKQARVTQVWMWADELLKSVMGKDAACHPPVGGQWHWASIKRGLSQTRFYI
jgi:hypothetical protein